MTVQRHVVFGCSGPVGIALMEQLLARGDEVVGVSRSGRAEAPSGVTVVAGDAADRERAAEIAQGADVLYSTIGIDYRVWKNQWMPIVEGLLHAAQTSGARLVFADNLYCYGPQDRPLREDMPLTEYGRKPALRAHMVRRMLEAHASGAARVAFVRASDFFGPRTTNAMLGERVFGPALRGKAAQFIGNPDLLHAYTYVPDFARALLLVGGDEGAFGRAWHVPNPPTRSSREVIGEIYEIAGKPMRLSVMPGAALTVLSWLVPIVRELKEMGYQWTQQFEVDASEFAERYGFAATPWGDGLGATVEWYRRKGAL